MSEQIEKLKQEITDLDIDRSNLYKIVDKLENRISTLEKVIGKLQLRLGDVVLYIDKIEKEKQCPTKKQ